MKFIETLLAFVFRVLLLSLIVAAGVAAWLGVVKIPSGNVMVIKKGGMPVDFYTEGRRFVWQAAVPWLYSQERISLSGTETLSVEVPLPELANLNDKRYRIKVSMTAVYRIDPHTASVKVLADTEARERIITKMTGDVISAEFAPLLEGAYNEYLLQQQKEELVTDSVEKIVARAARQGILIENLTRTAPVAIPSQQDYYQGTLYQAELYRMYQEQEKRMILLEGDMKRQDMEKDAYYAELGRISKLLKDNPNLIKYIFIDRLSDRVKVILPPDTFGITDTHGGDTTESDSTPRQGPVDNLR